MSKNQLIRSPQCFYVTDCSTSSNCANLRQSICTRKCCQKINKHYDTTPKNGARVARKMINREGIEALYSYVQTYALERTNWCPAPEKWTLRHSHKMKDSVRKKLNENKKSIQLNHILFPARKS